MFSTRGSTHGSDGMSMRVGGRNEHAEGSISSMPIMEEGATRAPLLMWDWLLDFAFVRRLCQIVSKFRVLAGKWQNLLYEPPPAARSSLSSTLSVLGQLNVVSGWSPAPQGPGVVMTVFVTNHHSTPVGVSSRRQTRESHCGPGELFRRVSAPQLSGGSLPGC